MKKIIHLFFLTCGLLIQGNVFANTVIVKGYVKDSANHAVANKTVKIYSTDSSNHGCILSHTTVTNPDGYYIDTLTCTGDIRKLAIIVSNCNGTNILHDPSVTSANFIESNFIICAATATTPANCRAVFSYTITAAGIRFNSAGSQAPAGDSIISRSWSFGDSTHLLTGNRVDPTHVYTKTGTHTVCLSIKTKKGCESKYCTTLVYTPAGICYVQVHANTERISARKFRFTSNTVSFVPGDTIVQRIWNFGDNTSLKGNVVYPIKEYKDTGIYHVCVSVKTARGCENQHCFTVIVRGSTARIPRPTHCKAYFTYTIQDSAISFSSARSSAPDGDSIISRTWYYADSTKNKKPLVVTGNLINTVFTYSKPGAYRVYLLIKTKKGCESKYAATIVIAKPTTCRLLVQVSSEKISGHKFRFSSSLGIAQGDSIIRRNWKFGDGTQLEGNEISPSKEYKDTGVYTVCVAVKTKNGCEKEYCLRLVVRDSISQPRPTSCKAIFTYRIQNRDVQFNSAASTAGSPEDSIISRAWFFGEGSNVLPVSNLVNPVHVYAKAGSYQVYLYIKTKKGCESKYAGTVLITSTPANCAVQSQFSAERISLKKVQFNSSSSAAPGDSIIQRRWKFGDGTGLEGNESKPLHEFPLQGVYSTCLQVRTARGCETQFCRQVNVQDSFGLPPTAIDFIRIVTINPNPVITRMVATIWCRNNNTEAEISIYDIYGTRKLSLKKVLTQGNNAIEINTELLSHGSYFLKVTAPGTRNSRDSKAFYKL